jgi:hypothetical protein
MYKTYISISNIIFLKLIFNFLRNQLLLIEWMVLVVIKRKNI